MSDLTVYECTAITGGATNALDALNAANLVDADMALVTVGSKFYVFRYNASGTAAENVSAHPYIIRPDDYVSAGTWEEYICTPYGGTTYLTDGVAAPAAIVGQVQIYVDTADGHLKVKHGDGQVNVISPNAGKFPSGYSILGTAPDIALINSATNQADSGTIDFLEGDYAFGAASGAGFRITYDGSANKLYIKSASGTTVYYPVVIERLGNLGIGPITAFGTSATRTFGISTGVAPSTSPADMFQLYSADRAGGDACPHIRTEDGKIIILGQEAHIADPSGGTPDAEARTAINAIIDALKALGFLAPDP